MGEASAQSTKYRKLGIWWWSPAAVVPDIWAPFVSDWQQLGGLKNAGRSREEGGWNRKRSNAVARGESDEEAFWVAAKGQGPRYPIPRGSARCRFCLACGLAPAGWASPSRVTSPLFFFSLPQANRAKAGPPT